MTDEEVGSLASDIVFTVDDGVTPDAAHFFPAGVHLLELLDDLAETPAVEWTLDELRMASAVAGLAPVGEYRNAGVDAALSAVAGLVRIRNGDGQPNDWSPNAVAHAKDMARRAGDRAKLEVLGNVVWLDQELRTGLDSIAPWVREFYGSVRGQLTGVNVTRGNRASIKPHGGGRVIHVGFPSSLSEAMREGLLQFVEIEGTVRQNEDGRNYYVSAEQVRIVSSSTTSWQDLRGSMPEITDGLSVTEYLSVIRGEE